MAKIVYNLDKLTEVYNYTLEWRIEGLDLDHEKYGRVIVPLLYVFNEKSKRYKDPKEFYRAAYKDDNNNYYDFINKTTTSKSTEPCWYVEGLKPKYWTKPNTENEIDNYCFSILGYIAEDQNSNKPNYDLFKTQDQTFAKGRTLPPYVASTPWNKNYYSTVLGKTLGNNKNDKNQVYFQFGVLIFYYNTFANEQAVWSENNTLKSIKNLNFFGSEYITTDPNEEDGNKNSFSFLPMLSEWSIEGTFPYFTINIETKSSDDDDETQVLTDETYYRPIFPPLLQPSQPAFAATTNPYQIYFSLSDMTSWDDVTLIGLQIHDITANNASIINTKNWPDGIIYIPKTPKAGWNTDSRPSIRSDQYPVHVWGYNLYSVWICDKDLIPEGWTEGHYYRVNALLSETPITDLALNPFPNQNSLNTYLKTARISEWSTSMILKALAPVTVELLNKYSNESSFEISGVDKINIETNDRPLFTGRYYCKDPTEYVKQYKFYLYKNGDLIEDSGWILHQHEYDELHTSYDRHTFNTKLETDNEYMVGYSIVTNNEYTDSDFYSFVYLETFVNQDQHHKFDAFNNDEEGTMELYFTEVKNEETGYEPLYGTFYILRRKWDSNIWDQVGVVNLSTLNPPLEHKTTNDYAPTDYDERHYLFKGSTPFFEDFTIESGEHYIYAIQSFNVKTRVTYHTLESESGKNNGLGAVCNFEHMYLYRDGVQLKFKYDSQISSYKKTVLEQKQDTIGSKYPIITRNGYAYYSEFQFKGLMTFHADEARHFLKGDEYVGEAYKTTDLTADRHNYTFKDQKVIDYFKHLKDAYGIDGLGITVRKNTNIPNKKVNPTEGEEEKNHWALDTFDTNLSHNNIYIERKYREAIENFFKDLDVKLFKSASHGNMLVTLSNIQQTPKAEIHGVVSEFSCTCYEQDECTVDNMYKYGVINDTETEETVYNIHTGGMIEGRFSPDDNIIDLIKEDISNQSTKYTNYTLHKLTSFWIEEIDISKESLKKVPSINNAPKPNDSRYTILQSIINRKQNNPDWRAEFSIDGNDIKMGITGIYGVNDISDYDNVDYIYITNGYPVRIYYTALETENSNLDNEKISSYRFTGFKQYIRRDSDPKFGANGANGENILTQMLRSIIEDSNITDGWSQEKDKENKELLRFYNEYDNIWLNFYRIKSISIEAPIGAQLIYIQHDENGENEKTETIEIDETGNFSFEMDLINQYDKLICSSPCIINYQYEVTLEVGE